MAIMYEDIFHTLIIFTFACVVIIKSMPVLKFVHDFQCLTHRAKSSTRIAMDKLNKFVKISHNGHSHTFAENQLSYD